MSNIKCYTVEKTSHERKQRALGKKEEMHEALIAMLFPKQGEPEASSEPKEGVITELHRFYALAHAAVHEHEGLRVGSVVLVRRNEVERYVSFEPALGGGLKWRAIQGDVRVLNRLDLAAVVRGLIADGAQVIEVFTLPGYEVLGLFPVHAGKPYAPGATWWQCGAQWLVDEILPEAGAIVIATYECGYDERGEVIRRYRKEAYWGREGPAIVEPDIDPAMEG
jgi:hypothetical protein